MLFKDAANEKSNQKNLGTIQCSNLCTEIIQYTDEEEVDVEEVGDDAGLVGFALHCRS